MTLDPGAAEVLEKIRENNIPEWHTLAPSIGREMYRTRVKLFTGDKTQVGAIMDERIEGPGGPLALRIYTPEGGAGPWPILVYLHGGGWTLGDLDSHDELCRRLCLTSECIVVAVDYRLAPENPFPAPLDDCVAAVRWVAEHGAEFDGDVSRLAIGGDSAGGNLSAGASLHFRDHGGPSIALQVLIYPALRVFFDLLSSHENATGKLISRADVIWFWENFLGSTPPNNPYAAPGSASDLTNLPPALIITAGFDPLRDDGEVFGFQLRDAGNQALVKRYPGMIHGFMGLPVELSDGRDAISLVAKTLHSAWNGDYPIKEV
jgi:acetyl esterase